MRFIVFQPIPRKEIVYAWIDGERKRRIKFSEFINILKQHGEGILFKVLPVMRTYSFYLVDLKNESLNHLTSQSEFDSVATFLNASRIDVKDTSIDQKVFSPDKSNIFLDILEKIVRSIKGEPAYEIPTFRDKDIKLSKRL